MAHIGIVYKKVYLVSMSYDHNSSIELQFDFHQSLLPQCSLDFETQVAEHPATVGIEQPRKVGIH